MKFQTIGFIGLGLIGGSIAKAIKYFYPETRILAYSRSQGPLREALEAGAIDHIAGAVDASFGACDLIFLSSCLKGADFRLLHPYRCGKHKNRHP